MSVFHGLVGGNLDLDLGTLIGLSSTMRGEYHAIAILLLTVAAVVIRSRDSTLTRPPLPVITAASSGSSFSTLNYFVLLCAMDVHRDAHTLLLTLIL